MKKILLLFLFFYSNNLFSQIVAIKDSLLNTTIKNVNLSYQNIGTSTDKNGIVNISVFNDDNLIKITHVGYHSKKILKKDIAKVIYLQQKTNLLPDIVLSENIKIPLAEKHPIFSITPSASMRLISQTASLIASKSPIVVQESQPGGGSPNYRGMEANRLLLIIDGVPLNNAIYRSGHVQSSSTINPFFVESFNLVSGPASVAYGNGAMGGGLIFNTKSPSDKTGIYFNQQFESSSNIAIVNLQANYQTNNISHTTLFSLKSADNLKMGRNRLHGYENWGNEKTVTNNNEQLYTDFTQIDFLHKSRYITNSKSSFLFNTQYSNSSNIFRFDKMNDMKDNDAKYTRWYYGPQARFLQKITHTYKQKTLFFESLNTNLSFQQLKESRHIQKSGEVFLNNRNENVKIYDFNMDFSKNIKTATIVYGAGLRNQKVLSTATLSNGNTISYNTTRYPDGGSSIKDVFAYGQANLKLNKKLDLLVGGRWNSSNLLASFNDTTFDFQFIEAENASFVKSLLISYAANEFAKINLSYYGGFRNPNIDDIGKVFSKDGVNVVVPNNKLEPEYANNIELNFNYSIPIWTIELQLFNTQIKNAISRGYGSINGLDSMYYDGEIMRIQMNKNIASANINGASFSTQLNTNSNFSITARCNYLKGLTHEKRPLAHIPPFNAKVSLDYKLTKNLFNFYINYSAFKEAELYDDAGVDNLEEATIDGNPSWYTLNLNYILNFQKNMTFSFGVANILDVHYKTFASGISASGRNFIISLSIGF